MNVQWDKHPEYVKYLTDFGKGAIPSVPEIAKGFDKKFKIKLTPDQLYGKMKRLRRQGKIGYVDTTKTIHECVPDTVSVNENEQKVLRWLKKEALSIGELSRRLDRSKETIIKIIQELHEKGYDVVIDTAKKQAVLDNDQAIKFEPLEVKNLYRKKIRFGVFGDTQFGSKYQQMTMLYTCFKIFDEENVDFVIHTGDLVDGIKMYRGQEYELFLHGADEQREYVIKHFPKLDKGKKCYIISGNHDLSFKKNTGYNIVREVCKARKDIMYRGDELASFQIKGLNIDVMHPSGGVSYARSYRPQRIVENSVGQALSVIRDRITNKDDNNSVRLPHCVFFGHWHVSNYIPSYMGVENFMVPCLQSQTPYLKRKGLAPELGCLIMDVTLDDHGNVTRIIPDFRKMNAYVKENDF